MSGLTELGFYGSAFGIALLSSGHCGGMCGPIAIHARAHGGFSYQLGRLLGYVLLGFVIGASGSTLSMWIAKHPEVEPIAFFTVAGMMVWQAYASWNGGVDHAPLARVYRFAYQKGFRRIPEFVRRDGGAFGMGFGTAFLPCGLILTFAWVAAATRSPFEGAALFFLLWAGSLPALMVATVVGEKLLQARKGSPALRRGLVLAVLVLGLATLARKGGVAADLAMKQEIPVCHVSR